MSMFPRFLRPISATAQRRSYSFFSSKSGGGRYFNSAKPPKVVPTTSGSGNGKVSRTDASASTSDASSPSGASKSPEDAPSSVPAVTQAQATDAPPKPAPFTAPSMHFSPLPSYPPLNAQDLKLHQFFSLHRPLSLYQPTSALFEPSAPTFDFGSLGKANLRASVRTAEPASASTNADDFDEVPEASPEADADAARQLARALVMNRVGGALSWDAALQKMGMDVNEGRVPVEGVVVDMDSTKRKRRRKMKKHKLKKRRKASRAHRLKIGR